MAAFGDMRNLIHREFDRHFSARYSRRTGMVTSYDPKTHSAKVQIHPNGAETGWLPILTHLIGKNFGHVIGPAIGDQVEMDFQEGDIEAGRITGRLHSDVDTPPQAQSGENILITQFNHFVKMLKDGSYAASTNDKDVAQQNQNSNPTMSHTATSSKSGSSIVHTVSMDPVQGKLTHQSTKLPTSGDSVTHSSIFDVIAKTITHQASGGSDTHSVVLDVANGISRSSTKSISDSASGNVSRTSSSGSVSDSAQGGISRSSSGGSINDTAAGGINFNGPTSVNGNLGVSGSIGASSFSAGGFSAGGGGGASVSGGLTSDSVAATTAFKLPVYTIAGLATITGPVSGMMVFVSDTVALATPTFDSPVLGGGSTSVHRPVFYNAAALSWRY